MHTIIQYPSGRRAEAILLAMSEDCMRIVVRKRNETLELKLVDERWTTEEGVPIEIEALVSDGHSTVVAPRTLTAANGSSYDQ